MKKSLFALSTTFTVLGLFNSALLPAQNTSPNWSLAGNSNAVPSSRLGTTNNVSLRFYTNNVQRMIINSAAGLVGIGTTSPNSRLHVNSAAGENPLRAQVNGSTKFFVDDLGGVSVGSSTTPPANGLFVAGNVGIGTASPKSKLDVAGSITGFSSYFTNTAGSPGVSIGRSGANYGSVGYGLTFTNTTDNYLYNISFDFSSMISFRSGGFDFNTAPAGTLGNKIPYTTAMAILQNGNVGIGTSIPPNKLYVTAAPGHDAPVAFIENTGGTNAADGLDIKAGSNTEGGAVLISFLRPDGFHIGEIFQNSTSQVAYGIASDKRLKNIIGASQKGLSDLMKINIYDYTFKSDPGKKVLTGFMAQELYEVFPQSVSKPRENNEPAEKNPWMVDYGSVTPLIIKSVQEQQQIIEKQQTQMQELSTKNADLQSQINDLKSLILKSSNGTLVTSSTAFLKQNIPNPASNNTVIRYYIPDNAGSAQIKITDVKGSLVKTFNVIKGEGQVNIKSGQLSAGTYNYTLYVNNKTVDTKQMVLVK